jgi:hypothetical protein
MGTHPQPLVPAKAAVRKLLNWMGAVRPLLSQGRLFEASLRGAPQDEEFS